MPMLGGGGDDAADDEDDDGDDDAVDGVSDCHARSAVIPTTTVMPVVDLMMMPTVVVLVGLEMIA